ncbi:AraC family transcriptional regulator [Streptomyces hygroscopicus]|uniref:AlkA N-terminal domain-containing protein n=1 Tax=Streptomyces hygroscopicus TaxID=1912 RepID=UPI00223F1937|nr:AlkA N-terminal domain-containing protein [Streptomyces hygroscopicus]MCW7940676.1 AraC family transcriptional regulator [Streptomyces hygroscopicus]
MNDDSMYEALCSRDARFDGEFFFAVSTTGIYCRPSCPATTPKRHNVRFFATAAAAQHSGFRACRRCRPDAVPGSAEWNVRADAVGRAMRLIGDGVVDREGVAGLAARLGYSARQVQRQLNAEVGAGPIGLARAQRAHTARILLQTTGMRATEVAFAAGFASVRQFNDTIREIYATTPSGLRAAASGRPARPGTTPGPANEATGVPLRLAYRGPYAATEVFDYLAARALTGVEELVGARGTRCYRRTLRLPLGTGVAEVGEKLGRGGWLECRLHLSDLRDMTAATQRMRRLLDLDADPYAVAERLGADATLAPLVAARPGLRAPGAADSHELAARAVLGQQVSVSSGRRLGNALVAAYGQPFAAPSGGLTHLFPDADALAEASLEELGMPESRRDTLRTLAGALASGTIHLDPGAERDEAEKALLDLPGIGPWTAGYIRMRALCDPDVLLTGDAAVQAGMRHAGAEAVDAEAWRPWRTYAMHHFWNAAVGRRRAAPA